MKARRLHPRVPRVAVGTALVVAGWLTAAAGTSILGDVRRAREDDRRVAILEVQRRALLGGHPPATAEAVRRLSAAVAEAARAAEALATAILGPEPPDRTPAADASVSGRAEAFFDLAWFAEEMRATAAAANVELAPREAFGFAEHAEGAPRSEDVAHVERQRERIERLLRGLFAAGPARLEHIRRERPVSERSGRRVRGVESGAERDYFDPDPATLFRHHRKMDTMAFQIAFVATGAGTLRAFLNGLLTDPMAWVVRSVQVKPLAPGLDAQSDRLAARPLRVELIVESVESGGRTGAPMEEAS